ncbi:MAG TPA: hypothetical protein PKD03_04680 [Ignavibacteriaceae bacterium]|mgnify:FL=1|nr:hypothetical protein [Ignavibacteriaceae bacterium]
MFRVLIKLFFFCLIVSLYSITLQAQNNCISCHKDLKPEQLKKLTKVTSSAERGLGIMDRGQVANYLGNYGILSNFHEYFNESVRWPKDASDVIQYCYGLGLVVASKNNVITSVVGGPSDKYDWAPKDGSRGKLFSGDVKAAPPDETPFLALSDNPETWPKGYFDNNGNWIETPNERHWPGKYRIDIDPDSPNFGNEVVGEFVSDRDIYCIFDDKENSNPQGPLGIEVEQTAYSYGRPYAEDMLIWSYNVRNTSSNVLDSIYLGYYAIFRPDFDNADYINIIDSNPGDGHQNGDFVYVYDINNTKDGAWASDPTELGMVGLNILETPKNMGVTDFHYFSREFAPKTDEEMWAIISSNPNNPNLMVPSAYFHGPDKRMDITNLDSLKKYFPTGAAINYFIMTGPFTLNPGETVNSAVGLVMGNSGTIPNQPDTVNLMSNMRMLQQLSKRAFQGSGPPKTPIVRAVAGDKEVKLFWDSAAEDSRDVLTGKKDFEGYKIYRSDNLGKTWGTPITDQFGKVIGYKPIKIFDLIDGIKGPDPAFNQWLGDDSGIKHTYTDKNLLNGVEYWYCVTSYDKGNQNPDSLEQSYQSPLGSSILESNTVSVVPGVRPQNFQPPDFSPTLTPEGSLPPIGGVCQGFVSIEIVDPDSITGDDYVVTFVDSTIEVTGSDTNYVLGLNLYRINSVTRDTTILLDHHLFSDESRDNLPVTDGFRLVAINTPSGVAFQGWTLVNEDTSTFQWSTKPIPKYIGDLQTAQEEVYTIDDYRITIDTIGGLNARLYDYFTGILYDTIFYHLPLKVEVVTDPNNPIDVSQNTLLIEFAVKAPWEEYRKFYYSRLGWDLIPGGNAYSAGSFGFYERYPDMLNFERYEIDPVTNDTTVTGLVLRTNNQPDTYINADGVTVNQIAIAPSQGDQFTIRTFKPFRKEIRYEFSTRKAGYTDSKNIDLSKIRAVPDPYIVSNEYETSQFGKRLMFNHLPNECKISIYTVAGDFVDEIYHNDNRGFDFWDLRTYNDQYIAYGLYVFVVKLPDGTQHVGKFLVIK